VTAPPQNQAENLVEEKKEISCVTLSVFGDIAALVADALMRVIVQCCGSVGHDQAASLG
jgi:hypothetical protein